ncbi:MAG: amidase [Gammaproteobacteria bacterium]|nr:amidase [Gammaproteobacteria bacterium]
MYKLAIFLGISLLAACSSERDFSEHSISDLHDSLQRGELSSEELVGWYIERIDSIDRNGPALNSILEINPDALGIARALDKEWRASGPRGPLHGIPVVLKANIDTSDQMYTTAGSLALADHVPPEDAFVVKRLRDAGAIILGKANLSEWANFRSTRSSSGWSSIGGQTLNPYDTLRTPCGSSSGSAVAVAANLTSVAIGTETDGSVVCPSGINGIVGIKPTLGLVSRSGIIPIAHSQDTAGPMGRTVRDAAILLTAMTGIDPDDIATADAEIHHDYTANLTADGLLDKRVGVLRSYHGAGDNPGVESILASSIAAIENAGAIVVDDLRIEITEAYDDEYEVLLYEFHDGLNSYLQDSGAPVSSLSELIQFNDAHATSVMPIFGQEILLSAVEKGPLTESAYTDALATSKRIAQTGIDKLLLEHDLDALIAPTNGPAWMIDHANGDNFSIGSSSIAAISGYPGITVPAGFASGLPIGLTFVSKPWNEKQLIELAYAFEQTTRVRKPPDL